MRDREKEKGRIEVTEVKLHRFTMLLLLLLNHHKKNSTSSIIRYCFFAFFVVAIALASVDDYSTAAYWILCCENFFL